MGKTDSSRGKREGKKVEPVTAMESREHSALN